ncbi:MAG TPA: alpha/beta hydrolase [Nocardioidaceae bacterium]|nr:alpha/beta hydrolase [Nocardioidaceae bacterium]
MSLLAAADAQIEYVVTGAGDPVTLFAHGLAGSIPETRPFGSGVEGSKAFLHFRGHGGSSAPATAWTYAALAAEARTVADHVRATRAVGVSLGAGALLRLASEQPDRFDRLVLLLPAAIDRPRGDPAVLRMQQLADLVDRGRIDAVAELLVTEQPASARGRADVRVWAKRQAQRLAGSSVATALRELPAQAPLTDRAVLERVRCPVLVVAQREDAAHPVETAAELAAALPHARLKVFDEGGVLWTHRRALRTTIATHLNPPPRQSPKQSLNQSGADGS